ncbi:hypothetical protein DZ685_07850 [Salmonella enterica]|nr:hypothetical protein [Salmonella enterica]EBI3593914.1 hypothetical protein [Salmonella enterica]ECT4133568.1 hypothetical protein [Salmonella enterica]EEI4286662.1 hypothetical protein [Salmonella enterica]EFR7204179.1 hypothetical protein [Salmonella enterica]
MSLPLREYYTLDRASELLRCTNDDLIHWAMVGCIRIYIKIEQAYGRLLDDSLSNITDHHNNDMLVDGTKYKDELIEIEKMIENEDDGFDYYHERASIIYSAMRSYMMKHGDVKFIDEIGLRSNFAFLNYYFNHEITEDFCAIRSVEWMHNIFNEEYPETLKDIPLDENKEIVDMQGFFGLGGDFFVGYDFYNKFCINKKGELLNSVIMPESELQISVISDSEIDFAVNSLFIFKNDFIAVQDAMKNNTEIKKKYPFQGISSNHCWWKWLKFETDRKEHQHREDEKGCSRVSRPAIAALNILISKYHSDIKQSPSKLAEVLTAEARELGIEGIEFDKNTVSRWIKKPYQ